MAVKSKSTREKLIEIAYALFYDHGFHEVGLDRILAEAKLTKTTFYNHFESKDALILEVLREHDLFWRRYFAGILREHGGDDPRDQIGAIFDALDRIINSDEFRGCVFINAAVEFPSPHSPAHQAAQENKRGVEMLLCDLAARAGAADPINFAREMTTLMEGVYVRSHICRDGLTTDIGRRLGRLIIDKHLPAPG